MQAAPALPALPNGQDFADWLSPILVKELRQGLKSRAFVATFIIVQVTMILLVGMQLLTAAGGGGRSAMDAFNGFFWAFVWLPMLVMMPARGLTAVSEEVKANTLDLVQLTHLSALRIVLGKWLALISQTLLLVAAILPYAVLRYFFGEVDVFSDLRNIGLILLTSMWLTAGAIALSSLHLAVRIVVLVVLLPMFLMGFIPMILMRAFGGSPSIAGIFEWGWLPVIFTAVYSFLLLEIAATRIAPISENHSAPKRLLALGLALVGIVLAIGAGDEMTGVWLACSSFVFVWVALEALCERTILVPSLYYPLSRRGALGRGLGRILYPGWASGLLFTAMLLCMIFVIALILARVHHSSSWERDSQIMALVFPLLFAAIITPVVVLQLFPKLKQPVWIYILVQGLCALLFTIASVAAEAPQVEPEDAYRWLAPIPTSALLAMLNSGDNSDLTRAFAMVTIPVSGIIILYLALKAIREFRIISQLEREALGKKANAAVKN